MDKCRLCQTSKQLRRSHIVPKTFFDFIKKNSPSGGLRRADTPNKRREDGLVLPFLCNSCEELFSKYEKYFIDNIFSLICTSVDNFRIDTRLDDDLRYFILSVAWRTLQYNVETDYEMLDKFTQLEKNKLFETLETWRTILISEDKKVLRDIQMHLIPTDKLSVSQEVPQFSVNNFKIDFKVLGKEDSFRYAFTYVQIPHFIMLCTVWGHTSKLRQFQVGGTIRVQDSNLPNFIRDLIAGYYNQFLYAQSLLYEKQLNSIKSRAKFAKK